MGKKYFSSSDLNDNAVRPPAVLHIHSVKKPLNNIYKLTRPMSCLVTAACWPVVSLLAANTIAILLREVSRLLRPKLLVSVYIFLLNIRFAYSRG